MELPRVSWKSKNGTITKRRWLQLEVHLTQDVSLSSFPHNLAIYVGLAKTQRTQEHVPLCKELPSVSWKTMNGTITKKRWLRLKVYLT